MGKLIWKHARYPKRTYRGEFGRDKHGERYFCLLCEQKTHRISFESPQAAKKMGWIGS